MSLHNRIVWHEGLFIRPQHFQQQERHWEYQLHNRLSAVDNFSSGLLQLLISQEHLQIGQIALIQGSALFADGSFCRFPDEDSLPAALTISTTTRPNQRIFLALALNTPGSGARLTERYQQHQQPIADLQRQGHSGRRDCPASIASLPAAGGATRNGLHPDSHRPFAGA